MADTNLALREEFSKKLALFAINMYSKLTLSKPNENIVFSPFSIQTCAAMARIGAEGETAAELDRGLGLVSNDVNTIAETFNSILSQYENSNILKIANKIYVMSGYTVQPTFNELISKKFYSTADEIDFAENTAAASTINSWVESKTNNLIKNLISPDALSSETRLVLLNAIHFKGIWEHQFEKRDTKDDLFYLNESDTIKVPMMRLKKKFRYADLPQLDATALEMPYKDSDLSMLIILPNSRTGLKDLEAQLKNVELKDITQKMYSTEVIVRLPRFKTEFSVELNEPFKQLGMARMFSNVAEFGKMLETDEQLQVSKVIHKAFIEVNEEGTEAAAATAMLIRKKRCLVEFSDPKEFNVEHSFFYVLSHKSQTAVAGEEASATATSSSSSYLSIPLFMGSVSNFVESIVHDEF